MTRDFAIVVLLVAAVILLVIMLYQHAPQPELPLVTAAAPIIAPVRSAPCTIPLPTPKPVRHT